MEKISLLQCTSYNLTELKERILSSLENINFDLRTLNNKRVGIKPNLLTAVDPESAVVTHPEFFRAVVQIVKENGGKPVITESPAVIPLSKVIKKTGYSQVITEEGVEIPDGSITEAARSDRAVKYKKFDVMKSLFEVDMLIALPKLKTHGLMYFTGGFKNLFGTIPGGNKAQFHLKAKTSPEFAAMLCDLYTCLFDSIAGKGPFIHIMDAIVGLDGEGPGVSGNPIEIGAIIAGRDPIAMDVVATRLVGLPASKVLTIGMGGERGLGIADPDEIEIVGGTIEEMKIEGFTPSSSANTGLMTWVFDSPFFKNLFIEKPLPLEDKCILCYQCKNICPAGAIGFAVKGENVPLYDYSKCIRCYCCMEICPEAAIVVKKAPLQWIWKRAQLLNMFMDN